MVVKKTGTKEEVWAGTAHKTKGGLTVHDLVWNPKTKKPISAKKHAQGVKNVHKTLGVHAVGHAMLGGAMLGGYLL